MEGPVQHRPAPLAAADIASALDWWRDAGVDLDFADEPTDWLPPAHPAAPGGTASGSSAPAAARAASSPAPAAAPPPMIGGAPEQWPGDLAAFAEWWLTEPSLDAGQVRDRVAPRGARGAELMIVVPQPEAEDGDLLLSGPEGRLLDAFLAAAGLAPEAVYRTAALPRHTPVADWPGLAAQGLGRVLAHHIGLVAPARLLVFGGSILPLLGNDPPQTAPRLSAFYHE